MTLLFACVRPIRKRWFTPYRERLEGLSILPLPARPVFLLRLTFRHGLQGMAVAVLLRPHLGRASRLGGILLLLATLF